MTFDIDTGGRPDPGPLTFTRPSCPLCGAFVDGGPIYYYCYQCRASWHGQGGFRHWLEPAAAQCDSISINAWSHLAYRCVLAAGHAGFHKHPAQAGWRIGDRPRPQVSSDLGDAS